MNLVPKVLYQEDGSIALITINRPQVHNCIDGETADGLYQAFSRFRDNPAMNVAILTGSGSSFSSGADLKAIDTLGPIEIYDHPDFIYDGSGYLGFTRLTNIFKPTIAAVHGYCYAGGLEMAAWCDIRIASYDATFGCLERRYNVPLVDGGTQRLPRIVGWGRGMDLILTGREINSQTALEWGLVTELVDRDQLLSRARDLALQIAAYPQGALRTDKQAAVRGWGLSIEEGLRIETQLGMTQVRSTEFRDGVKIFENRKTSQLD